MWSVVSIQLPGGAQAPVFTGTVPNCVQNYVNLIPECNQAAWQTLSVKENNTCDDRLGYAFGHLRYVDSNCNQVAAPRSEDLCGSFVVRFIVSPLSLIWHDSQPEPAVLRDQFSLDPQKAGSWYLWRASAAMPLLAYDPQHEHVIHSAAQLFGTWTFGGKKSVSLASISSSLPWSNGYEALAALDENGDGKISGRELAPLVLWFDGNRNAVSDPGEVVDIQQAGITALYTTPDYNDPVTGDLHARLGYERTVNGGTITGASFDWYSPAYSSPAEALLSLKAHNMASDTQEDDATPAAAAPRQSPLNGAWLWRTEKRKNVPETEGILSFKTMADNNLSGHSFAELPLNLPFGKAKKFIAAEALSGTLAENLAESISFTFTVQSSEGTTVSTARWIKAEDKIIGESEQQIRLKDKNRTTAKFSYSWTAQRIGTKTQ